MFIRLIRHDGTRLLLNTGVIINVVDKPGDPKMAIVRTSLVSENRPQNYTVQHSISEVHEMLLAATRKPASKAQQPVEGKVIDRALVE